MKPAMSRLVAVLGLFVVGAILSLAQNVTGSIAGVVKDPSGSVVPSITVFAGGGTITLNEMLANVRAGRQMILLAGSGRSTDAVLEARADRGKPSETIKEIAAKGKIEAFDLRGEPQALAKLVRDYLTAAKR